MKFKLFKTQITVSYLFISIITFMIFIDKSGFILPMMLSVVLHEMAHLLTMSAFGCEPMSVNLIPCSVEIKRDICKSYKKEILISLSGPFLNIFLFVIFLKINLEFSLINLCFGLFTLLPLSILDGGEILKVVLSHTLNENKAKIIFKIINFTIGVLGIFLGVFLLVRQNGNISLILFSVYIILFNIIKI